MHWIVNALLFRYSLVYVVVVVGNEKDISFICLFICWLSAAGNKTWLGRQFIQWLSVIDNEETWLSRLFISWLLVIGNEETWPSRSFI